MIKKIFGNRRRLNLLSSVTLLSFKGATVAAPPLWTIRFKSSYLRLGTILVYTSTYKSPKGRPKVSFNFFKHDFFSSYQPEIGSKSETRKA